MDSFTYKPSVDAKESFVADGEHDSEIGIDGECPICAKLRDPVTGNLPWNAETIAAAEEARAMMKNKTPSKQFENRDDLKAYLKEILEN